MRSGSVCSLLHDESFSDNKYLIINFLFKKEITTMIVLKIQLVIHVNGDISDVQLLFNYWVKHNLGYLLMW